MPDIVSIGEILVEIMTQQKNQSFLEIGDLVGPFPSGAPAIFADSAAKIGGKVGIISAIGNDDFGKICLDRLQEDGVDISQVQVINDKTTGTAFVTNYDFGERQYIFHFTDSAAGAIKYNKSVEQYIKKAKYLHIMGCSVSASKMNMDTIHEAVKTAIKNDLIISFDPNVRKELLQDENMVEIVKEIVNNTNILLTGVEELKNITGKDTIEEGVSYLQRKKVHIIVVKNGKHKVHMYTKEGLFTCDSINYGEVIDPVGAGDCFDGAFIACLSKGYSLEKSLEIATIAGSISVTKKGPMEGTSQIDVIKKYINKYER